MIFSRIYNQILLGFYIEIPEINANIRLKMRKRYLFLSFLWNILINLKNSLVTNAKANSLSRDAIIISKIAPISVLRIHVALTIVENFIENKVIDHPQNINIIHIMIYPKILLRLLEFFFSLMVLEESNSEISNFNKYVINVIITYAIRVL